MRLRAHGFSLTLPHGWSGRIFSRTQGLATLHAGNFALALGDGEFGDSSTGRMRPGGVFVALTEYRPGGTLRPSHGLFTPRGIPLPLHSAGFATTRLAHPRAGQVGMQHFFTAAGRPLCLYVVLAGSLRTRPNQLATVNRLLGSLHIASRG